MADTTPGSGVHSLTDDAPQPHQSSSTGPSLPVGIAAVSHPRQSSVLPSPTTATTTTTTDNDDDRNMATQHHRPSRTRTPLSANLASPDPPPPFLRPNYNPNNSNSHLLPPLKQPWMMSRRLITALGVLLVAAVVFYVAFAATKQLQDERDSARFEDTVESTRMAVFSVVSTANLSSALQVEHVLSHAELSPDAIPFVPFRAFQRVGTAMLDGTGFLEAVNILSVVTPDTRLQWENATAEYYGSNAVLRASPRDPPLPLNTSIALPNTHPISRRGVALGRLMVDGLGSPGREEAFEATLSCRGCLHADALRLHDGRSGVYLMTAIMHPSASPIYDPANPYEGVLGIAGTIIAYQNLLSSALKHRYGSQVVVSGTDVASDTVFFRGSNEEESLVVSATVGDLPSVGPYHSSFTVQVVNQVLRVDIHSLPEFSSDSRLPLLAGSVATLVFFLVLLLAMHIVAKRFIAQDAPRSAKRHKLWMRRYNASLAHDLRTPLHALQLVCSGIRETMKDASRESLPVTSQAIESGLEEADAATIIMMATVRNMMHFGEGHAKVQSSLQPVSVQAAVGGMLFQSIVRYLGAVSVDLHIAPELDETHPLLLDVVSLQHVFCNLLTNAIKFTPVGRIEIRVEVVDDKYIHAPDGTRHIHDTAASDDNPVLQLQRETMEARTGGGAGRPARWLAIQCLDTGLGVANPAQLFQPFSLESMARSGAGLGLFAVRTQAHALGGSSGVYSPSGLAVTPRPPADDRSDGGSSTGGSSTMEPVPGPGSCFWVTMPYIPASALQPHHQWAAPVPVTQTPVLPLAPCPASPILLSVPSGAGVDGSIHQPASSAVPDKQQQQQQLQLFKGHKTAAASASASSAVLSEPPKTARGDSVEAFDGGGAVGGAGCGSGGGDTAPTPGGPSDSPAMLHSTDDSVVIDISKRRGSRQASRSSDTDRPAVCIPPQLARVTHPAVVYSPDTFARCLTQSSGGYDSDADGGGGGGGGGGSDAGDDAPSPSRTILVVDDTSINRRLLARVLAKIDPQALVHTAEDGRDAVARMKAQRYDLVLMDIQMPNMDGLEATRRIRAWETKAEGRDPTRIYALSASVGLEDEASAAGMDGWLSKPVTKDRLASLL